MEEYQPLPTPGISLQQQQEKRTAASKAKHITYIQCATYDALTVSSAIVAELFAERSMHCQMQLPQDEQHWLHFPHPGIAPTHLAIRIGHRTEQQALGAGGSRTRFVSVLAEWRT